MSDRRTGIRQWFSNGFKSKQQVLEEKEVAFKEMNERRKAWGDKPLQWEDYHNGPRPEEKTSPEVKP
jgi:large subunit ribosomal protein L32